MKFFIIPILFLCLVSCKSVDVSSDYDRTTNFTAYKSYNYFSNIDSGLTELDEQRLIYAIDSILEQKSFVKSETPDFLINIQSQTFQSAERSSVSVGIGGGGGNVGGGVSVGIPVGEGQLDREVVFEFLDAKTQSLFWHAIGKQSIPNKTTPELREQIIKDVASEILSVYPPEKE
ncbi:MAG: hypothetical protein BM564_10205 [Bacteroidetes bacterium MedPE-SWsnd-G2]|nr:MAG: hypothetical protein BM564_10205 [Bacteroidetes bacterium MedPE-SWsnd-G2]